MKKMYERVQNHVREICARLGREEPELIAVSKMQPRENVEAVLRAGHKVFGENRVQEAQGKWPEFQEEFGKVELHLLGPLQTNKVNAALGLFDVIHSLDRMSLAKKLSAAAQDGRCPDLFVQVNTGREPQKAGVLPEALEDFLGEIGQMGLPVIGLMCIPPVEDDPRGHFVALREMAARGGLKALSMGMSGDYEIAIEEGATHIRVGSAIFGARSY